MGEKLFENEEILQILQPHPLSFMQYHALWLTPFIWGISLFWIYSKFGVLGKLYAGIGVWLAGLAIIGIVASLLLIRWRIFIAYMAIAAIGLIIMWKFNEWENFKIFIPAYTAIVSIFGILLVETYRKSHRYIITNFRVIMRGDILKRRERSLRYEKISDLNGEQGIIGRIFGFGNIIPVTPSGFGLGEDQVFAGGGAGSKGKRLGFFGFTGGGKSVEEPRARSYYELHGVHPYREIKDLIEELIHESSLIPYQRKQIELSEKMVDLLDRIKENKK